MLQYINIYTIYYLRKYIHIISSIVKQIAIVGYLITIKN